LKEISEQAQLKCSIRTDQLSKFIEVIQALQIEINNMDGDIHDTTDIRESYQNQIHSQAAEQDERGKH